MSDKVALSLIAVAVGFWLMSNPRCNRGCKTFAEHLASDGLDGILNGLFA